MCQCVPDFFFFFVFQTLRKWPEMDECGLKTQTVFYNFLTF